MIDPIGKTLHRLGMQLPGCSLIPREDHRVAATGSGQIEPALAAVPSLTGTRAPASVREARATGPDRSQNSRDLHDRSPPSLYVSSVTEFRKPEIVA
jgi:hypothetical protein